MNKISEEISKVVYLFFCYASDLGSLKGNRSFLQRFAAVRRVAVKLLKDLDFNSFDLCVSDVELACILSELRDYVVDLLLQLKPLQGNCQWPKQVEAAKDFADSFLEQAGSLIPLKLLDGRDLPAG